MTIGFFTVLRRDPQHYVLADILVRSVRAVMPDVELVHFTDDTSPGVPGVDRVQRGPGGRLLQRRLEVYAACDGDWLLLDTDIVVQHDVRHVFARSVTFDVALADRNWNLVKDHYKYSTEMPFNTGVVFQRSGRFYARALQIWTTYDREKQGHWWSEQWAVADAAREGRFVVDVLPGMVYNRPPALIDEDLSDAAIVHYKGPIRKLWMTQRAFPNQGYELVRHAG